MNIILHEVYRTIQAGDRFWNLTVCYINGDTVRLSGLLYYRFSLCSRYRLKRHWVSLLPLHPLTAFVADQIPPHPDQLLDTVKDEQTRDRARRARGGGSRFYFVLRAECSWLYLSI